MDKAQRIENRKKLAVKNFIFNRYLFVRYMMTSLFFANLYWLLMLLLTKSNVFIVPAILIVFSIGGFYEFVKLYGKNEKIVGKELRKTKLYFQLQTIVNTVSILLVLIGKTSILLPVLNSNLESALLLTSILLLGLLVSVVSTVRIIKIQQGNDSYLQLIRDYKKTT